jgi:glycosyltransferase involved in cell wall biosynthesis
MNLKATNQTYSIAIPAYRRPNELIELFDSIYQMDKQPNEIIICEDFSKDRKKISEIVNNQIYRFSNKNLIITYIENEVNLGYDANIRKLINKALSDWVILIGNDDLFLKEGITNIDEFCTKNNSIAMASRTFIRFENDINKPLGTSSLFNEDKIIKKEDDPRLIFRTCGFVGGLVIKKEWAKKLETTEYDGTLYYQIYLSANAFCTNGIGYIAKPTVAARTGNPPMFGESEKDRHTHIPGSYSAKGRATMWKGVLDIANNVGKKFNINLHEPLRNELMVRQSFHIFEMNVGVKKEILNGLKEELQRLNLFNHWFPKTLYYNNLIFGKKAFYIYYLIRKIFQ